jgi:hypothetical protein
VGYMIRLSRNILFNCDDIKHDFVCRMSDLVSSLLFNTVTDLNETGGNLKPICSEDEAVFLASLWKKTEENCSICYDDEQNQVKLKSTNFIDLNSVQKVAKPSDVNETESPLIEKDQILSFLFGSSLLERRMSNVEHYESCNLRLAQSNTSNLEVISQLKNNIQTYQSERDILHDRMEALRKALKQLEADDLELEENINNCIDDIRAAEKAHIVDNTMSLLGHEIKFCKEFMAKAVSTSKASTLHTRNNKDSPRGFDLFLVHVHNLFKSHQTCVNVLRDRVRINSKRVRKMVSAIVACFSVS